MTSDRSARDDVWYDAQLRSNDMLDRMEYIREHQKSPESKRDICPQCEGNKWASVVEEPDDVYFRCTNCGYKRELFKD